MIPVRCRNCGLLVQVPRGGKRLCGCGEWLSAPEARVSKRSWKAMKPRPSRLAVGCRQLLAECGKVIVGQRDVLEQLVLALIARGHCLLVGVPGLAKTLMIRTVADAMSLTFNRVQFTPDLMPADITGTEVLQEDRTTGTRGFKFLHGPLFANVILADEINRTPPRLRRPFWRRCRRAKSRQAGIATSCPTRFRLGDPKSH